MNAQSSALPAKRPPRAESPLRADLRRRYAMTSGSTLRRVLTCARAPGVHAVLVLRFEAPTAERLAEIRGDVEAVVDRVKQSVGAA